MAEVTGKIDELSTAKLEEQLYKIKLGDDNYSSALAEAEEFKNQGNNFVKENKWDEAIEFFTKAIDMKVETCKNSIYLSNRALINLKLENTGLALEDANKAIEIDPGYIKAYYRRASAYLLLRKFDEALPDLKLLQAHFPNDNDIKNKITITTSERRKKKFLESIQSDQKEESKLCLFRKALAKCSVDKSYSYLEYVSDNAIENATDKKECKDGKEEEKKKEKESEVAEGDDLELLNLISNSVKFTKVGAFNAKIDEKWVVDLMNGMKDGKFINKKFLVQMLYDAKCLFDKEKSLVDIKVDNEVEISVCGDTHGQFYDLLNIFKINGLPSEQNPYLFNGDFVDRGSFSVEVVVTLLAWKLLYPRHFYLSRGNHESKNLNKLYGFEGEVRSKYDDSVYELFCSLFCSLPLCHVINNKIFVAHGGLFSKDDVTLDNLRDIDRFREPPESGLMCEILWSDPCKQVGRHPSKRGVGLSFGPDVTKRFLEANNLEMVVRSHEVKHDGYEVEADGKLVTVFSAPNYCDQMGNKGALIRFKGAEMKPKYVTFEHVEHPKVPAMKYANPWMMF